MTLRRAMRATAGLAFGLALVLPAAVPVAAQDAAATVVTPHDYYFGGLPTSVPAGTTISLANAGAVGIGTTFEITLPSAS